MLHREYIQYTGIHKIFHLQRTYVVWDTETKDGNHDDDCDNDDGDDGGEGTTDDKIHPHDQNTTIIRTPTENNTRNNGYCCYCYIIT